MNEDFDFNMFHSNFNHTLFDYQCWPDIVEQFWFNHFIFDQIRSINIFLHFFFRIYWPFEFLKLVWIYIDLNENIDYVGIKLFLIEVP